MEPALHWICHQLPFFSVLLCSKRQSIYFKRAAFIFHLSQMFLSNLVSLESSPWGLGFSYFGNVRLSGYQLLRESHSPGQNRQFWIVIKAAAEAILHWEQKGSEIVLIQLGPHGETLVKRKEPSCVSVLTLSFLFFTCVDFSMLSCWKGGRVKDLILRYPCSCCC